MDHAVVHSYMELRLGYVSGGNVSLRLKGDLDSGIHSKVETNLVHTSAPYLVTQELG